MNNERLIKKYASTIIDSNYKKSCLNEVLEEIKRLRYVSGGFLSEADKIAILKELLKILNSQTNKAYRFSIDEFSNCINLINSIISTHEDNQNSNTIK